MATPHWQSGWLLESPGQPHGNFEMVRSHYGPLEHHWRDAGHPDMPWRGPNQVADDTVVWHAPNLILSSFGNLEVVGMANHERDCRILHYFRNALGWHGPHQVTVTSRDDYGRWALAHLQRRTGNPPIFELVVGDSLRGGLSHFSRREDVKGWRRVDEFGQPYIYEGLGMIHSSYGALELVGTSQGSLYFMWRGDHGWSQAFKIGVGSGRPGFIQSSYGRVGNFELVVPAPSDKEGLLFYWRNNDDPRLRWSKPLPVPGSAGRGRYQSVSLMQSSYDGHLEVLAERVNGIIDHYWRDRDPTWSWHGPYPTL